MAVEAPSGQVRLLPPERIELRDRVRRRFAMVPMCMAISMDRHTRLRVVGT